MISALYIFCYQLSMEASLLHSHNFSIHWSHANIAHALRSTVAAVRTCGNFSPAYRCLYHTKARVPRRARWTIHASTPKPQSLIQSSLSKPIDSRPLFPRPSPPITTAETPAKPTVNPRDPSPPSTVYQAHKSPLAVASTTVPGWYRRVKLQIPFELRACSALSSTSTDSVQRRTCD